MRSTYLDRLFRRGFNFGRRHRLLRSVGRYTLAVAWSVAPAIRGVDATVDDDKVDVERSRRRKLTSSTDVSYYHSRWAKSINRGPLSIRGRV